MNTSAIVAMTLTCGFVWGGFLVLLGYGVRQEKMKRASDRKNHQQLER